MNAIKKLIARCNEMDITEQLNWLGDASMSYQAKLELAALTTLLKEIEWSATVDGYPACPSCGHDEFETHAVDCKLAAALEASA